MIIVLVGESASGKSTIEKLIHDKYKDFSKVVSYTTRPMRDGEQDGVDYHYITDEQFYSMVDKDEFIEKAQYRGWNYGSAKSNYDDGQNHIVVLTPHGCRSIKKWSKESGVKVVSIYFKGDRKSRMIKILNRGDDIDEAYRRNISDVGQFDGFEDEADYIIENNEYSKSVEDVFSEVEWIINEEL